MKSKHVGLISSVAIGLILSATAWSTPYLISSLVRNAEEYTGYGGTGAQGALTVSGVPNGPANPAYTDNVRTYMTAASTAGATTITVNSTSGFAVGNEVLVIQMLGSGAGTYDSRSIASLTATTLTFGTGLTSAYPAYSAGSTVTQVIMVPQYTTVTITSGGYLTAHAFDGMTGGVLFFRANTSVNINYNATLSGTISVTGKGYAGGGASAAGSGPGGGAVGTGGTNTSPGANLMRAIMGSGGGGATGAGGTGGGLLMIKTSGTLTLDGNLSANGAAAGGTNAGGGAGGTMAVSADTITRTTTCGPVTATGGAGNGTGTVGGIGRIFLNYKTSSSCTSASPASGSSFSKFIVK